MDASGTALRVFDDMRPFRGEPHRLFNACRTALFASAGCWVARLERWPSTVVSESVTLHWMGSITGATLRHEALDGPAVSTGTPECPEAARLNIAFDDALIEKASQPAASADIATLRKWKVREAARPTPRGR